MIGSVICGFLLLSRLSGYGTLRRGRKFIAAILTVSLITGQSASAETVTIAALGDSLTQGYGLGREEGFVPQLQAWLAAQGAETVIVNAGVSGDTTAGGLARLDWTLTPEVGALIVELGGNDMLRGLPPSEARKNIDAILTAADLRGLPVLVVGVQALGNFGDDYRNAFDAIYPELAAVHDDLLYPDFFFAIRNGSDEIGFDKMQADGIHPNADGVSLIVTDIGPHVLDLISRVD